jgi:hypothetical protein
MENNILELFATYWSNKMELNYEQRTEAPEHDFASK